MDAKPTFTKRTDTLYQILISNTVPDELGFSTKKGFCAQVYLHLSSKYSCHLSFKRILKFNYLTAWMSPLAPGILTGNSPAGVDRDDRILSSIENEQYRTQSKNLWVLIIWYLLLDSAAFYYSVALPHPVPKYTSLFTCIRVGEEGPGDQYT